MELRWTEDAAADLERITHYLFEQTPERGADLVRQVYTAPYDLLKFPIAGGRARNAKRESLFFLRCLIWWSTALLTKPFKSCVFCMALRNGLDKPPLFAEVCQMV